MFFSIIQQQLEHVWLPVLLLLFQNMNHRFRADSESDFSSYHCNFEIWDQLDKQSTRIPNLDRNKNNDLNHFRFVLKKYPY